MTKIIEGCCLCLLELNPAGALPVLLAVFPQTRFTRGCIPLLPTDVTQSLVCSRLLTGVCCAALLFLLHQLFERFFGKACTAVKEAKETRLLIYAYQFEVYRRMLPVACPPSQPQIGLKFPLSPCYHKHSKKRSHGKGILLGIWT